MDTKSGDKSIRSIIKNRKFWFKIISISIPLLAILMIEIVLRKVEYGEELSLFKEYSKDTPSVGKSGPSQGADPP